jgi:hypothetical protein
MTTQRRHIRKASSPRPQPEPYKVSHLGRTGSGVLVVRAERRAVRASLASVVRSFWCVDTGAVSHSSPAVGQGLAARIGCGALSIEGL